MNMFFIINRKKIALIFLALTGVLIVVSFFNGSVKERQVINLISAKKVIIDAGHGGLDGGVTVNDAMLEKDVNLKIAQILHDTLKDNGYTPILTRDGDYELLDGYKQGERNRKRTDLNARLKIIKDNPDAIFVSVHINKFEGDESVNGPQVYYSKNNQESTVLADSINKSLFNDLNKEKLRETKKAGSNIYLLWHSEAPSVIVECGFVSNKNEGRLLADENYQKSLAQSIFNGINAYYSAKN